jgi:hypothetical protein
MTYADMQTRNAKAGKKQNTIYPLNIIMATDLKEYKELTTIQLFE